MFAAADGNYVATYDTTPPNTLFTATPSTLTNLTSATFAFSSSEAGSVFECRFDGGSFGACASGTAFSGLASGVHTFEVRAIDAAGNVDPTPVSYSWTVDTVGPTVTGRTPAPGAANVSFTTNVVVTFSESIDASSVSAAAVSLRRASGGSALPGTLSVSGTTVTFQPSSSLLLGVLYEMTVDGTVRDLASNTLGTPVTWTFTVNSAIADSTAAQFGLGTVDANTRLTEVADGEIALSSTVGSEFPGNALPAGWESAIWSAGGGSTVSSGALVVNGSRASTTATFTPGRALEFVATFTGEAFQHVGLGLTLNETPFILFSTNSGGAIWARTHNGTAFTNTQIAGSTSLLNVPQRFRIEWNASSVVFFINGATVATHNITIPTALRPIVSDYLAGAQPIRVDWLRLTPYAASGTFTSRVIDGGGPTAWGAVTWTSEIPAGTSVVVQVRTGATATPDGSWTGFTTVGASGGSIGQTGRYVQYRLQLSTSDDRQTPVVRDVTLNGVNQ